MSEIPTENFNATATNALGFVPGSDNLISFGVPYRIKSVGHGTVLDDWGGKTGQNSAALQPDDAPDSLHRAWVLVPNARGFRIKSLGHGTVLDDWGGKTGQNSAALQPDDTPDSLNRTWVLVPNAKGFRIKSLGHGTVLDDWEGKTGEDSAALQPDDAPDSLNRTWTLVAHNFNSFMQAGFYGVAGSSVAQHTYATLWQDTVTYAFPCFGGFALGPNDRGHSRIQYPASLWTPYLFGSKDLGTALPANLMVALGMAQFTLTPRYDYRAVDWDTYWDEHPPPDLSFGCWAGLVYGIDGVCHQACNRILWATRQGDFENGPVNWPSSFSETYWLYGYWGKTYLAAIQLAEALVERARLAPRAGATTEAESQLKTLAAQERSIQYAARQELRETLDPAAQPKLRERLVMSTLTAAPGGAQFSNDSSDLRAVIASDRAFHATKLDLDNGLLREEVTHDEYARRVNDGFNRMLLEFRAVLPPDLFATLFPDASRGKVVEVILRSQMPPSYRPYRDMLKI